MEVVVQGGPCDTVATLPDATSTLPPGPVEPTAAVDRMVRSGYHARGRSRTSRKRETSRIALPPIREPRGYEDAGQASSPAVAKDPDCRGRLAVKLLRLLGGRR